MTRAASIVLLLGTLLNARTEAQESGHSDPEILLHALSVARAELTRQHVGPEAQVVFDIRSARRGGSHPATDAPFSGEWGEAHLERVEAATGMSLGTLETTRTCVPLRSGRSSCTLRPARAVVAAAQPQIRGDTAIMWVHLWFQPEKLRFHPETKEPFEVHHSQAIEIELTRKNGRWAVTRTRMGPPGTSLDRQTQGASVHSDAGLPLDRSGPRSSGPG